MEIYLHYNFINVDLDLSTAGVLHYANTYFLKSFTKFLKNG